MVHIGSLSPDQVLLLLAACLGTVVLLVGEAIAFDFFSELETDDE